MQGQHKKKTGSVGLAETQVCFRPYKSVKCYRLKYGALEVTFHPFYHCVLSNYYYVLSNYYYVLSNYYFDISNNYSDISKYYCVLSNYYIEIITAIYRHIIAFYRIIITFHRIIISIYRVSYFLSTKRLYLQIQYFCLKRKQMSFSQIKN